MAAIREVAVMDVVNARDERVALQTAMLEKWNKPLISFTMNIAGSIKYDSWIEKAFDEGVRRIEVQLNRRGIPVYEKHRKIAFTGCEQLWTVDASAEEIKNWMIAIEEADELGRLFDIDVIDGDGRKCSRPGEGRRCLLCGNLAAVCGRSRAHTGEQLFQKAHRIIEDYFLNKRAMEIAVCAERALLYEAITTPKPGLVDRMDSGAHDDMDLFTFADSACALREYFANCARIGMMHRNESPESVFERLRCAGIEAEEKMLEATRGVNTHKGALFSLGILCGAAAMTDPFSVDELLKRGGELAGASLKDFEKIAPESARTGGEKQYFSIGVCGARGEAAAGFSTLREVAIPAFESALMEGKSLNDAGLVTLVALMARVMDSNIIRRAGEDRQKAAMAEAEALFKEGITHEALKDMNARFIRDSISPGGSADLLAIAYFIHFMKQRT